MGDSVIKVLLIEDSAFAAAHTKKMLAEAAGSQFNPELIRVNQLSTGLEYLAQDEADVVLLDLTLPDSRELQTFWDVQKRAPHVPIVVLTGLEDEKLATAAVREGAEDYLIKGQVNSGLLKRSILYAIERKRITLELRKHQEHLEELVTARTEELRKTNIDLEREVIEHRQAQNKLAQKLIELEEANVELERYAEVAAHDLQEPLRMVASYTQLLGQRYKGNLDADADDFISFAVEGATRMQKLIDDLLTFSRIGVRGAPFKSHDCNTILGRVRVRLNDVIRASGAVISNDELPTIEADEQQVAQVLECLIGNALKFHGDAPACVHVSAEKKADHWLFSVSDNGIGVDPRYRDRIFGMFERLLDRETYPGTGAGLAISKKIIERHGGKMWVESELGQGSVFYFTIPFRQEGAQDEEVGNRVHSETR